ncbi:MAG: sodium-dependent bicarbonate transport family permease [Gammaproteobacteria bacterium]|nr:MAG: sodium-dependent bicarbonate transport family permease [Gammaproteobacteria bacterium]
MIDIAIALFALGVAAGLIRSDIALSKGTYDTLSILLMFAIGLKGGVALHGNLGWQLVPELLMVSALGVAIPLVCYPVLRKLVGLGVANSASVAAHYGSVSAGTFAVALAYVESRGLPMSPQTTLYLVLLEMPAIITGIFLFRRFSGTGGDWGALWKEAFTSRGVVLLVGGVIIGFVYGPKGTEPIAPLFVGLFKALLALFLLEMGLTTAKFMTAWRKDQWRLVMFALLAPPVLAASGLALALTLGLPAGTVVLLTVLAGSASYIAAPAAIRHAIPEADIGMAMFASLGLTFPLNVLIGIPVYHWLVTQGLGL